MIKLIKECIRGVKAPITVAKKNLEVNKGFLDRELSKNINGLETDVAGLVKFQVRILGFLKYAFFYPLVRMGGRIAGKHLINEPPKDFAFRNVAADYRAWNKALVKWHDVYLQDISIRGVLKRFRSFMATKRLETLMLINKLKLTLIMSDSAYFELYNIYLLELYKELGELHGMQPIHIIYKEKDRIDEPAYFVAVREGVEIMLQKRIQTLKPYYDKKGTLKTKYVGDTLTNTIDTISSVLNCVPQKEIMLNKIEELKQKNEDKRDALISINKETVNALQQK